MPKSSDLDFSERVRNGSPDALREIAQSPSLDEGQAALLLARKDLPGELIEEIAQRKPLLKAYAIKKALVLHPHTPRLVSLRLLRDLYLMDLVQLTLTPGALAELKRNAEEQVIARLPQLPLGQKITLARRGPGRVAGALLAEGHEQILKVVLDNTNLSEAHVLKALARPKLIPRVIEAISRHQKWSHSYNVRLALVRQPATTLSTVLSYLPELTVSDLRELTAPGIVPENFRRYLQAEIQRRIKKNEKFHTE
ncbi:MAG: hypothetical protein JSS69_08660 [Acidobacteria bacterium]|nr:hypothetical protein [Acidobacteriota bacterium]MBS1865976.1 hypothetical protein [Acidobacteriota bacterium]